MKLCSPNPVAVTPKGRHQGIQPQPPFALLRWLSAPGGEANSSSTVESLLPSAVSDEVHDEVHDEPVHPEVQAER